VRTCDICVFKLGLTQHDDLHFHPFSCKWQILFFFMAE
jgi:hypothetical protein